GSTSTITLVAGTPTATIITAATGLTGGAHTLTAVYSGDGNYGASTSANVSQTVSKVGTTTTITQASPAPSSFGQTVTFTVTLSGMQSSALPTGTVTLMEGASSVASTSTISLVGGIPTASITTATLPGGAHTLTAVYSGDTSYNPSTSVTF